MAVEKDLMEKSKMPVDVLPEDVELQPQDLNPSDIDVEMLEDGGAEINLDPQAEMMQGAEQHDANLAEFLILRNKITIHIMNCLFCSFDKI